MSSTRSGEVVCQRFSLFFSPFPFDLRGTELVWNIMEEGEQREDQKLTRDEDIQKLPVILGDDVETQPKMSLIEEVEVRSQRFIGPQAVGTRI